MIFILIYFCLVSLPDVEIKILTTPRVGEPLTLECIVTTMKDIVFRVDIEWRDYFYTRLSNMEGVDVEHVATDDQTERRTFRYRVPQLNTNQNSNVFHCTGIINTDPPLSRTSMVIISANGELCVTISISAVHFICDLFCEKGTTFRNYQV